MFTIDVWYDHENTGSEVITLTFISNMFSMSITPEFPVIIPISNSGHFDSHPSNGAFNFTWNPKRITFNVGKFGDGRGGDMIVMIENTPEIMKSLHNCFEKWNKSKLERLSIAHD